MYNGAAWDMLCYKSLKWGNGTGGGLGGELPYLKDRGAPCKFWKEPVRGTKIMLCGCGLNFFFTFRGTNFKTSHKLNVHSFNDEL